MRLTEIRLSEHAVLKGFLHELSPEMGNITEYPAMLVLPGGGFRICSDREAEPVALAYYAEGYQAFVLDYTTVTKKPDAVMQDPMDDACAALRYIRENRKELLVADKKLAMIGFSGGGHLAAAVSTHGPERPDVLLLGYPGIIHSDLRALDCPDIVESVDKQTPPSFIFGTRNDTVVPPQHLMAFAKAMMDAGNDFELHIFRDGVHGLSLAKSLTASGFSTNINTAFQDWFPMSIRWLKDMLGDFLIYGVNDGRDGKYSIDKPLKKLFENEEVRKMVTEVFPVFADEKTASSMKEMTLRTMASFMPGLDTEKLEELDKKLLEM